MKTNKHIDVSDLGLVSEMLDENQFWTIVSKSLENSQNQDQQEKYLIREISKLSPKEIIGFKLRTDRLLYDTYNSEMWCAAYLMNRGLCRGDGFEYFRNWLISRGKEICYKAKENPDNLITEVSEDKDDYEFEGFWYVALEAFEKKTGKDLLEYIDFEKFKTREGCYSDFKFNWNKDYPVTLKVICPQLFDRLWKHRIDIKAYIGNKKGGE